MPGPPLTTKTSKAAFEAFPDDQRKEPAQLTIDSLDDAVLQLILTRLLPQHGLIASPGTVRNWQAFLWSLSQNRDYVAPEQDEAWRAALAACGAARILLDHPPWRLSDDAERLYTDAAGLPALLVCKRWHRLLTEQPFKAKVAMCGVGMVPPPTTEVVVIASSAPWLLPGAEGRPQYSGSKLICLRDMPALRAVVFYCVPPALGAAKGTWHAPARLPTVPYGLWGVQHLLFVAHGGVHTRAMAPIEHLAKCIGRLDTLSLPTRRPGFELAAYDHGMECGENVPNVLLRDFRRIDMLAARGFAFDAACAVGVVTEMSTDWTALRSLHVQFEGYPDLNDLSDLTSVTSLCLEHETKYNAGCADEAHRVEELECTLRGFSWLPESLKSLELLHCTIDCTKDLGALKYLASLRVECTVAWRKDTRFTNATVACLAYPELLPPLTLAVTTDEYGTRLLRRLPSLVDLDLSMLLYIEEAGGAARQMVPDFGDLSALTRLTALRMHECNTLGQAGCAALGAMTRLERLRLSDTLLPDPAQLRTLAALLELRLRRCFADGRVRDGLEALQLETTCPGLRILEIELPSAAAARDACMRHVTALRGLRDLTLHNAEDVNLVHLLSLGHLRRLCLESSPNVSAKGLRQLLGCSSLRFLHGCQWLPGDVREQLESDFVAQGVMVKSAN